MGFLGGAATVRNVLTYCGLFTLGDTPKQAVRGVAEDVLDGLRRLNAVTRPERHRGVYVVFDPEAVKLTLDRLCAEAGVEVFLDSFVSEASGRARRSPRSFSTTTAVGTGSQPRHGWTRAATAISRHSQALPCAMGPTVK
jgi:hypothetical protein